jgi:hypothetical protein
MEADGLPIVLLQMQRKRFAFAVHYHLPIASNISGKCYATACCSAGKRSARTPACRDEAIKDAIA